eukprot:CAMPEP_0181486840 /NCGR_PEP_ID=MMETSP1110-20121109/47451_1 /TAXON_ID=174948 /ORGANISM="Symbiodinium sp., Strain CCMP421" /LENGTH=55 /DNA_ID=CAMNT_0023613209 /DNA_START=435 /DNA_END=602 /DNA_ORIENTATION=+
MKLLAVLILMEGGHHFRARRTALIHGLAALQAPHELIGPKPGSRAAAAAAGRLDA